MSEEEKNITGEESGTGSGETAVSAVSAKKKMPVWLKVILIVLISAVGLAVLAAAAGLAYYQHIFNQISLPETVDYVIPPESEDFVTDDPDESYVWYEDDETDDTASGPVTEDGDSDTYGPDGESSDSSESGKPADSTTSPGKSNLTSEKVTYQDPASIEWPESMPPLGDDGLINIMLVGQDNGNFKSRGRSDSMILLSVNPSTGGITLTSFLRDTYVQIGNGYSDNRLNVAYKYGGFPLMFDVFKRNFGITCDYGVVVNFESFIKIIDTLGGVDLSFTESEVRNLVKNGFATYPDGSVVKIGLNKNVPGKIALAYARIRKIDSDFNRTARQRKLLISVYNRFKDADLATILKLVGDVTDYIRVYGMTSKDLIDLATMLYPLVGNEIKSYNVPASGEYHYASVRGMSVIMPDLTKIRSSLAKKLPLGTAPAPVTSEKTTEPAPPATEPAATSTAESETAETTEPAATDSPADESTSPDPGYETAAETSGTGIGSAEEQPADGTE